jgi:voltage-gated potassium channel
VIRAIRLLRIFRVLKLAQYLTEANALFVSLRRTGTKITVFFAVVMIVVLILGATMYVIEGQQEDSEFNSIPKGVYWAIVTVTTVGYGDIAPTTPLGRAVAAVAMILGYSIIVVPTGIFSAELIAVTHATQVSTQACPQCSREGHDIDADFCKYCGARL